MVRRKLRTFQNDFGDGACPYRRDLCKDRRGCSWLHGAKDHNRRLDVQIIHDARRIGRLHIRVKLDQTIKVRFDGSLNEDMPWEFKPVVNEMELRIGETGLAFYEAYNPTDHPVAGQASYNVTPYAAGAFFEKIECFCFTEQVLAPGERVQMPVSFFVDPEIVEDRDGKYVHTITLSYTFYEIDLPEDYEAPDQDSETNLN